MIYCSENEKETLKTLVFKKLTRQLTISPNFMNRSVKRIQISSPLYNYCHLVDTMVYCNDVSASDINDI